MQDTFLLPPAPPHPDPTGSGHARTGCVPFLYNNFSFSAAAHHISEASFRSLLYGIWLLFSCLYFLYEYSCQSIFCNGRDRYIRSPDFSRPSKVLSVRPHMKRYIYIVIGHPVFFMGRYQYLDIHFIFPSLPWQVHFQ